jgi:hypothetical protein
VDIVAVSEPADPGSNPVFRKNQAMLFAVANPKIVSYNTSAVIYNTANSLVRLKIISASKHSGLIQRQNRPTCVRYWVRFNAEIRNVEHQNSN